MAKTKTKVTPYKLMRSLAPIEAWLRTKAPNEIVARNVCSARGCLGATFLIESGYTDPFVMIETASISRKTFSIGPRVANLIQAAYDWGDPRTNRRLTAKQALIMLEEAKSRPARSASV